MGLNNVIASSSDKTRVDVQEFAEAKEIDSVVATLALQHLSHNDVLNFSLTNRLSRGVCATYCDDSRTKNGLEFVRDFLDFLIIYDTISNRKYEIEIDKEELFKIKNEIDKYVSPIFAKPFSLLKKILNLAEKKSQTADFNISRQFIVLFTQYLFSRGKPAIQYIENFPQDYKDMANVSLCLLILGKEYFDKEKFQEYVKKISNRDLLLPQLCYILSSKNKPEEAGELAELIFDGVIKNNTFLTMLAIENGHLNTVKELDQFQVECEHFDL